MSKVKYSLSKLSSPGFTKEYSSELDMKAELFMWVCGLCIEDYNLTKDSSIDEMLETPCGCEFEIKGGLE